MCVLPIQSHYQCLTPECCKTVLGFLVSVLTQFVLLKLKEATVEYLA